MPRRSAEQLLELARSVSARVAVEDAVMPTASAPAQFSRRSSTKTHVAGLDAEALGGEQVDLGLRLVQADLGRDHDGVEELGRAGRGRSARCSTSSRSGRCGRRRPAPRRTAATIGSDGRMPRTCCRSGPVASSRPRRSAKRRSNSSSEMRAGLEARGARRAPPGPRGTGARPRPPRGPCRGRSPRSCPRPRS